MDISLYLMERELDNVANSQTASSKGQLGTQVPMKKPVTQGPTRLFSHLHAKPERGQQFFFFFPVKDQRVNILYSPGQVVSDRTVQLCPCGENRHRQQCWCSSVPIKLYLKTGQGAHLPTVG